MKNARVNCNEFVNGKIRYVHTLLLIYLPWQVGRSGQDGIEGEGQEEGEEPQRQLDCFQTFPSWGKDWPNGVADVEGDGESY